MEKIEKFFDLMDEYDELLDELLDIEEDKIYAISAGDIDLLNECIKDEEANVLKMRGMDVRRDKLTEEMGYKEKTFKQILDNMAADDKYELQPLFNDITEKTKRLKTLSESIRSMLESKMILNESKIDLLQNDNSTNIYDRNGEIVQDDSGTHIKSI